MQKVDNNLRSQWKVKSRSRLSIDGSFELHSSRCMQDQSFMALALIVSEKINRKKSKKQYICLASASHARQNINLKLTCGCHCKWSELSCN